MFVKLAFTVGAFIAAGLFIAVISADTSIEAFDEPGTPGKFSIQFALAIALILGWALGAGVEAAWDDEKQTTEWWAPFVFAALPRLFGGIVVFFVVVAIEIGFEALGVGLGAE
jgi:hypothetical protein